MEVALLGLVKGKVQGVWFRRFVQEQAEPRGITGYARNLPDGSVGVLLCGESSAVSEVRALVSTGPPDAEVDEVQWRDAHCKYDFQAPTGFSVL